MLVKGAPGISLSPWTKKWMFRSKKLRFATKKSQKVAGLTLGMVTKPLVLTTHQGWDPIDSVEP